MTGSFGMAFFRLLCVKFQKYTFNPHLAQCTVRKILCVELLIDVILVALVWIGTEIGGTNLSLEFCRGQTRFMTMILTGKTEEDQRFGGLIISFTATLAGIKNTQIRIRMTLRMYFKRIF